jgi:hypothetical protein
LTPSALGYFTQDSFSVSLYIVLTEETWAQWNLNHQPTLGCHFSSSDLPSLICETKWLEEVISTVWCYLLTLISRGIFHSLIMLSININF